MEDAPLNVRATSHLDVSWDVYFDGDGEQWLVDTANKRIVACLRGHWGLDGHEQCGGVHRHG